MRGDANADGVLDSADGIGILSFLFLEGTLDCRKAADANDDGRINLTDAVRVLLFAFQGQPLPAPLSACGVDPTPDGLSCEKFSPCF